MKLDDLRIKIDETDEKILTLFEERMRVVSEIAEYKKANGLAVLDRTRESEKLNSVSEKASDGLKKYARILYGTLFKLSREHQHSALQKEPTVLKEYVSSLCNEIREAKNAYASKELPSASMVACQGVEGSFAELAAERLFKQPPTIQYLKTYGSVFSAIENGFCDYGVLPLENSTAGSVNKVYRVMQNHNFRIVRSIRLKIDHHLVAPKGVKLEDIREVISHEQALAQCDGFLSKLKVTQTQHNNTAAAAEMVANSERRDIAAICSQRGAEQHGLELLVKNIQDNANNFTRFICISKNLEIYDGANLTDMILTLKNKQGSLFNVIKRINELEIDLGKLESRPTESDEDFMFYVTFKTAVNDELFTLIEDFGKLSEVRKFEYLGSYSEVL